MHASFPWSLLAASGAEVPLPSSTPGVLRDTVVILITVAALGILLFSVLTLWVKRRRSRHRHHRHHHRSEARATQPAENPTENAIENLTEPDTATGSHRHRRRKRRREHRPRNPTLAETGGLPPPRPEGQAPPGL